MFFYVFSGNKCGFLNISIGTRRKERGRVTGGAMTKFSNGSEAMSLLRSLAR
jgi:hypothetical protein